MRKSVASPGLAKVGSRVAKHVFCKDSWGSEIVLFYNGLGGNLPPSGGNLAPKVGI